nr:SRPBCC domain-containing protein [Paenibacillus hamazuiensis]
MGRKPVGQTADAGVQIGVRRTLPVSKEQAWAFLLSPEGLRLWIGELSSLPLQAGERFMSADSTSGQIKSVVPMQKIRMSWQPKEWDNPSTLQLYVLSSGSNKTTISFHQEKLDDIYMREAMKSHWEQVLDKIREHFQE